MEADTVRHLRDLHHLARSLPVPCQKLPTFLWGSSPKQKGDVDDIGCCAPGAPTRHCCGCSLLKGSPWKATPPGPAAAANARSPCCPDSAAMLLLHYTVKMVYYKVIVYTGNRDNATSFNEVFIKLVGTRGMSERMVLKNPELPAPFSQGQFLNGVNPMMIRRCTALPSNLPVTDDMVFLHGQHSLAEEMKHGNIFLCDYKTLDGLQPNTINGKKQYLVAPLVLLHKTPDEKLVPIAIQLKQTPGDDNPIFFPTDSVYDWLLAKIFVRSADFQLHQLNFHLLRTHLLAEVFAVSLLHNVSNMNPLFKLLVPHTRYTLQINILARLNLISDPGLFTKITASGGEALITVLRRSMSSLTYSSLCIQENISERGLESVPNFYYKEDGFRLWEIIHRFVQGILKHYYKNDSEVQKDPEIQAWIGDIFKYGFLSQENTGIPQKFTTVDELVKFVTMVIFTCSAQHSAVNNGQYEYIAWMPNTPASLQRPPPTEKGKSNESTILQTLPDVSITVQGMATMWLLSKQSFDSVPLGQYKEEYFTETTPRTLIEAFQEDLKQLSEDIQIRNETLENPYTYMDPAGIENSVAL
ncbi:hypothetical protein Q5P01_003094 [Channa striata]|uniref:Lipoxygenase domain-containing protein n=1 Tax=Channa striata TaxID=64152 RepID=A0AA88NU05_CHASR|nr:hypothetical protein Q5P01_003094 [Channa striata]